MTISLASNLRSERLRDNPKDPRLLLKLMPTTIKCADLTESIAASLQYIS